MTIDLIIPVYKPEKSFLEMVDLMAKQSHSINKIIIVNVEQKYFDRLVYSSKFLDEHKSLEIRHISKKEFDCGKTRNYGVKLSNADYFIMMSQYAIPVGSDIIEKLLKAFDDENVAVSFARQVSVDEAPEYSKFVRRYFFPEDSFIHSKKDVDVLSWNAYMCSNGCAMYKRSVFDELGGFLNHTIMNEAILYASKAINSGYKVSYVSDAVLVNTEEFLEKENYKKAFDFAVSVLKHPETFDVLKVKDEVKKLDHMVKNHLLRNGFRKELFEYKKVSRLRLKGFSKGLRYKRMTRDDVVKYSDNVEYWRMDEILRDRNAVDVHSGYGRSEEELKMLSTPPVKKSSVEHEE